jgi:hypothetical protein
MFISLRQEEKCNIWKFLHKMLYAPYNLLLFVDFKFGSQNPGEICSLKTV